jgi:DNA (cytosine-5)-methyltransferase 1
VNELALFAGAGGGILGGHLLGWKTVCAVEIDPYCAGVLCARQNENILPPFPVWDDVRTFDGRPWRGLVDVVSGGFPCTDISVAGKGAGIEGEQSGLWVEMARIIREVRPRYAFVENSPALTSRGLDRVLGDLAEMGFDARWGVVSAADVGAPHRRERIWIVADAGGERTGWSADAGQSLDADESGARMEERARLAGCNGNSADQMLAAASWWSTEPDVGRVADGVAARVDRLKALGNGQVPRVAATAWGLLT